MPSIILSGTAMGHGVQQAPLVTRLYPVGLDATKTFFVDQNNNPCLAVGDDAFDLIEQLTTSQIEQYLSDRASRGFNIIWLGTVDNIYCSSPPNNQAGNAPFSGGNFVGMSSQSAYWNFVDYVMARCLAWGITVLFNPAFMGATTSAGWNSLFYSLSTATIQGYASFLTTRYGGYPNLIWLLGGDANPTNASMYSALNTFAVAIKSVDSHLMTIEASLAGGTAPNGGYSSVDAHTTAYGSVQSWLDVNWVYQTASTVLSGAQRCYSQGKPCFFGETAYELENSETGAQVRANAYLAALGGCTLGGKIGNGAIWNFSSANANNGINGTVAWQGQLGSTGSVSQQLLGKLLRSREWQKLVPDTSNTVMTVGSSSGSVCARTSDGQSIIAYIPTSQTITIDMTKITDSGSQTNCNWYNPSNGLVTNIGTFANSSTKNFTSPDSNDWVLVIDSHAANLRVLGT